MKFFFKPLFTFFLRTPLINLSNMDNFPIEIFWGMLGIEPGTTGWLAAPQSNKIVERPWETNGISKPVLVKRWGWQALNPAAVGPLGGGALSDLDADGDDDDNDGGED